MAAYWWIVTSAERLGRKRCAESSRHPQSMLPSPCREVTSERDREDRPGFRRNPTGNSCGTAPDLHRLRLCTLSRVQGPQMSVSSGQAMATLIPTAAPATPAVLRLREYPYG